MSNIIRYIPTTKGAIMQLAEQVTGERTTPMHGIPTINTAITAAKREVVAKFAEIANQATVRDFIAGHEPSPPPRFTPIQVERHQSHCECSICEAISVWVYHEPTDTVIESQRYNVCPKCYHLPDNWR